MSRYVTISTDVDVYLDEIDTDDLIEELNYRGCSFGDNVPNESEMKNLLSEIFHLRRTGRDFSRQLDELIYKGIGRII